MQEILWLGNARLLLALNHFTADHPTFYKLTLFATDKFADILTLATFALLWFWPQIKQRRHLQQHAAARLNFFGGAWENLRTQLAMDLTREQSRAQFLVLGLAGVIGYSTARMIAFEMDISRPFMTYLPVRAPMEGAFEGLRTYGSFPSDHAVLLASLPVALLYWDRRLALLWAGISVILACARVAVGFHYPLDMVGGAVIGVLVTSTAFALYERRGAFHSVFTVLGKAFDLKNAPYCYVLYFLMVLGAVEFAMHFQHVLSMIFTLRGELLSRFSISS